jgi:putative tryptophan/tyrosine transport system substrate-binding protein
MRESRTYGSVRGARDETRVPTATLPTGLRPTLEDEIHMIDSTGVLDAFFCKRREFITLLGSAAAAWPLAARAQQPAMPAVGFVGSTSPGSLSDAVAAFHGGLTETGYVEGQNVAIEYRWAEGQYDRLPGLAADLVHRQVAVIVAIETPSALAAKAATTTIPIVFFTGGDPVQLGLVARIRRPDGNLTGVTALNVEVGAKRLELLHELVPTASVMVLLTNPTNAITEAITTNLQAAAHAFGLQLHILTASTERDFDAVFARLIQLRAGLVIAPDAFFNSRSEQLATLALRHAVPAIYQYREFAAAGGLISYGGNRSDAYRQVGVYTGRILKGAKPSELPVQQVTKVELFLNLKTAKALGITVPLPLSGRADEVIE